MILTIQPDLYRIVYPKFVFQAYKKGHLIVIEKGMNGKYEKIYARTEMEFLSHLLDFHVQRLKFLVDELLSLIHI